MLFYLQKYKKKRDTSLVFSSKTLKVLKPNNPMQYLRITSNNNLYTLSRQIFSYAQHK